MADLAILEGCNFFGAAPSLTPSPFLIKPSPLAPKLSPFSWKTAAAPVAPSVKTPITSWRLAPPVTPREVVVYPTPAPKLVTSGPTAPIPTTNPFMATRFPFLSPKSAIGHPLYTSPWMRPKVPGSIPSPSIMPPAPPPANPGAYIPTPSTVPDISVTPSNDVPDAPKPAAKSLLLPLAIAAAAYFIIQR